MSLALSALQAGVAVSKGAGAMFVTENDQSAQSDDVQSSEPTAEQSHAVHFVKAARDLT